MVASVIFQEPPVFLVALLVLHPFPGFGNFCWLSFGYCSASILTIMLSSVCTFLRLHQCIVSTREEDLPAQLQLLWFHLRLRNGSTVKLTAMRPMMPHGSTFIYLVRSVCAKDWKLSGDAQGNSSLALQHYLLFNFSLVAMICCKERYPESNGIVGNPEQEAAKLCPCCYRGEIEKVFC